MKVWEYLGVILVLLLAFTFLVDQPASAAIAGREIREGYIDVTGGKVWFRIVGTDKPGIPIILLHGGPGMTHDYLETLEGLADERPVIFYDQLGSGKSERPSDLSLWKVERFVEELGQIRKALKLDKVHILGQSWGTMLGTDYMLTKPNGVVGLILASPCLSAPRWCADQRNYLAELPQELQDVIKKNEEAGTTSSSEYQNAMTEYYKLHLCRLDPWPDALNRTFTYLGADVYITMWGPSEFYATGNLKDFDRTGRLGEITTPTLFTCGKYDEATPKTVQYYQSLTPNSKLVLFENSSHTSHLEETERYLQVVREFLHEVEKK